MTASAASEDIQYLSIPTRHIHHRQRNTSHAHPPINSQLSHRDRNSPSDNSRRHTNRLLVHDNLRRPGFQEHSHINIDDVGPKLGILGCCLLQRVDDFFQSGDVGLRDVAELSDEVRAFCSEGIWRSCGSLLRRCLCGSLVL